MSNLHHALWREIECILLYYSLRTRARQRGRFGESFSCVASCTTKMMELRTTYQTSVWVCGSHMDNILCWGITGNQSMILLLWISPTRKQEMAYIPGRIPVTNEIHFQTWVMYVTNETQSFWAFQPALHELHLGQSRTEIKYHFKHCISLHHTVALSLLLRLGATP